MLVYFFKKHSNDFDKNIISACFPEHGSMAEAEVVEQHRFCGYGLAVPKT